MQELAQSSDKYAGAMSVHRFVHHQTQFKLDALCHRQPMQPINPSTHYFPPYAARHEKFPLSL